jgi:uncharacterized protein YndB with AHSA1/START domain
MGAITIETTIAAPREQIWEILADLKAIPDYHPWVTRAVLAPGPKVGIGAGRMVHMRDGKNWVNERVAEWDEGRRQVVEAIGTSLPMSSRVVTTELSDAEGGGTVVRMAATYRFKYGPIGFLLDYLFLRNGVHRQFTDCLMGLKDYTETGRSSSNWLMSPQGTWIRPTWPARAA